MVKSRLAAAACLAFGWFLPAPPAAPADAPSASAPKSAEGEYVLPDFRFASGEALPELRIHYITLGKPRHDEHGRVSNAVLILHGMGGSGRNFLVDRFAGVLFGKGQLLDASRYYIILPDAIGHGASSKPSDGLHSRFPQYTYADMVGAENALLTQGLHVDHLRLLMGASMGCMHTWMWTERYPAFMDAAMPLACLPAQIAGRDRLWRDLIIDSIRTDPQWLQGEYRAEPMQALRAAAGYLLLAGSAPIQMENALPTRAAADEFLSVYMERELPGLDANDLLYQVSASRDYDPSGSLDKIQTRIMSINTADDFVDPPELGIAEREIKKIRNARFVLIPASDQTHGHGTATWAAVWQQYLAELLDAGEPAKGAGAPVKNGS
ncbi:MAG TPA: alpha/beta fold hydrolase [Steroidobacteraceae bacterium]|jgi:homoserine O-acetyltransferase|nr:alpha/beta fold hydrolase [Steroidobacteraceae bacterium]